MKQVLCCFFYLIPLTAGSVVAYSPSSLPKDVELVLQARVTDVYDWSEENKRYNLQNSQFDFQVLSASDGNKIDNVLHKDTIADTPKKDTRYLTVSSPYSVHFESVESFSVKQMVVKAKMSDNKEKLSVYFSEKGKNHILAGMLLAAGVDFPVQRSRSVSSDYDCHVQNKQLACSISYRLTKELKSDEVEPSSL